MMEISIDRVGDELMVPPAKFARLIASEVGELGRTESANAYSQATVCFAHNRDRQAENPFRAYERIPL